MDVRCIVVDDNHQYLETAARVLDSQGIAVVGLACDAPTALTLVEELNPDVVLVDVELGRDNGLDLVREIDALEVAPATILISTHSPEDLSDAVEESPAIAFVPKSRLSGSWIRELLTESSRGT